MTQAPTLKNKQSLVKTSKYSTIANIDPIALANFQSQSQQIKRSYSKEMIIKQLQECAARLGKSPTMTDFQNDQYVVVHGQTVVARFGSWNEAKRRAGLVPRRGLTRAELISCLQALGKELGRIPTNADLDQRKGLIASKGTFRRVFGSFDCALKEAGFEVLTGENQLQRTVQDGYELAKQLGHLATFREWQTARENNHELLSAWQIYRMFGSGKGSWSTFQFLISEKMNATAKG